MSVSAAQAAGYNRPKRWARWLGAVALLVSVVAAGVWWWLAPPRLPPWQPARWLVADADAALWFGPLDRTVDALGQVVEQVPGAQGILQAAELALGVDLTKPAAVAKAGLRADAGPLALRRKQINWLVVPVTGPDGAQHVLGRLGQRGYASQPLTAQAGSPAGWQLLDRTDPKQALGVLWYLPPPEAVVVVAWPDAAKDAEPAAAQAALADLRAAPPGQSAALEPLAIAAGVPARPDGAPIRGWWRIGKNDPLRMQLANALGPTTLVLGTVLDKVTRVVVLGELSGNAPRLSLALDAEPAAPTDPKQPPPGPLVDFAQYWGEFLPEHKGAMLAVGDLLPDETPLLVRARVNPGLLGMVPDALKAAILPSSALSHVHPALTGVDLWSHLLQVWDGQLAVGLLAVGDQVPLDPASWPKLWWRTALRPWVAFALKTDTAAKTLLERVEAALAAAKATGSLAETYAPAQFRGWTGIEVSGPDAPWWVLRQDRRVVFLSGQGTQDDLRRVAEARLPDWSTAAAKLPAPALLPGLVAGEGQWAGLVVQTPRVVRALRRRGVPDYATQLLASLASVSAQLRLTDRALWLDLELRPGKRKQGTGGAASGGISAGGDQP